MIESDLLIKEKAKRIDEIEQFQSTLFYTFHTINFLHFFSENFDFDFDLFDDFDIE